MGKNHNRTLFTQTFVPHTRHISFTPFIWAGMCQPIADFNDPAGGQQRSVQRTFPFAQWTNGEPDNRSKILLIVFLFLSSKSADLAHLRHHLCPFTSGHIHNLILARWFHSVIARMTHEMQNERNKGNCPKIDRNQRNAWPLIIINFL